jgi:hypothetical protein
VVPQHAVFEDIAQQTGARRVQLPGKTELEEISKTYGEAKLPRRQDQIDPFLEYIPQVPTPATPQLAQQSAYIPASPQELAATGKSFVNTLPVEVGGTDASQLADHGANGPAGSSAEANTTSPAVIAFQKNVIGKDIDLAFLPSTSSLKVSTSKKIWNSVGRIFDPRKQWVRKHHTKDTSSPAPATTKTDSYWLPPLSNKQPPPPEPTYHQKTFPMQCHWDHEIDAFPEPTYYSDSLPIFAKDENMSVTSPEPYPYRTSEIPQRETSETSNDSGYSS